MKSNKLVIAVLALLALSACDNRGAKGDPGAQGLPGLVGAPGATGPQGPAGLNGTEITIVKFCAEAPVYPSTFPEVGECINGRIYGVYSANDGFLAELPPGTYNSNAVGSTCTFTIGANCTITR